MSANRNKEKRLPAILWLVVLFSLCYNLNFSQTTLGVTGLLNSPSALISSEGTVKIGGNFLNTNITPDSWDYNTFNYFLSITFLPFVEVAINNTALSFGNYDRKFNNVDRSVSVRFRLLKERELLPAIVIGSNDVLTSTGGGSLLSGASGNKYFGTHYIAASKHFNISYGTIGLHMAFNMLSSKHTKINSPISGGVSFTPHFFDSLNIIAEYDTRDFNIGANALLFKYLYLQIFIQDLKYVACGIHAQIPLF